MNVRNTIRIVAVILIIIMLFWVKWVFSQEGTTVQLIQLGAIATTLVKCLEVFADMDASLSFLSRFKFVRTYLHLEPLPVFAQTQSAWGAQDINKVLNLTISNLRQVSGKEFALWEEWLEEVVAEKVRKTPQHLEKWGRIMLLRAERQSAEKAQKTYLNLAQNELYPALVRAEAYRELAYLKMQHDPSEATQYLAQSEMLYNREPKQYNWWESIIHSKKIKQDKEDVEIGRAQLQTVQAWYFAQQRQFGDAEKILQELEKEILFDQHAWSEVVSMYYNAYSEFAQKKGDSQKELEYQRKAYTYSENYPRRKAKYAHNMAERLMYKAYETNSADTYQEASRYLEYAINVAEMMNDEEIIAISYKTKGVLHALQGEHEKAVREYEKAEQRLEESNQDYYRALVSLDLAESYSTLKKCDFGRGYFKQALELNEKLKSADIEAQIEELGLERLVRECD